MLQTANILIADDHEFYRKGLISALKNIPGVKVIGEVSNGHECLNFIKSQPVDIILMDLNMPVLNGIKTAFRAFGIIPLVKIIALTEFVEETNVHEILRLGFAGLVTKDIDSAGLIHAVEEVIKGNNYYSPSVMDVIIRDRDSKDSKKLTKREMHIIKLVAQGLTNQEIADILNVAYRTITNHRANMHKKTGVRNTIQLLSWGMKNKLIEKLN